MRITFRKGETFCDKFFKMIRDSEGLGSLKIIHEN